MPSFVIIRHKVQSLCCVAMGCELTCSRLSACARALVLNGLAGSHLVHTCLKFNYVGTPCCCRSNAPCRNCKGQMSETSRATVTVPYSTSEQSESTGRSEMNRSPMWAGFSTLTLLGPHPWCSSRSGVRFKTKPTGQVCKGMQGKWNLRRWTRTGSDLNECAKARSRGPAKACRRHFQDLDGDEFHLAAHRRPITAVSLASTSSSSSFTWLVLSLSFSHLLFSPLTPPLGPPLSIHVLSAATDP